jgi:hypothetical protein
MSEQYSQQYAGAAKSATEGELKVRTRSRCVGVKTSSADIYVARRAPPRPRSMAS